MVGRGLSCLVCGEAYLKIFFVFIAFKPSEAISFLYAKKPFFVLVVFWKKCFTLFC